MLRGRNVQKTVHHRNIQWIFQEDCDSEDCYLEGKGPEHLGYKYVTKRLNLKKRWKFKWLSYESGWAQHNLTELKGNTKTSLASTSVMNWQGDLQGKTLLKRHVRTASSQGLRTLIPYWVLIILSNASRRFWARWSARENIVEGMFALPQVKVFERWSHIES